MNFNNNQNQFTFASLTFNHQTFIIEHLESIKYQIINYGKKITIDYVLCDDNSSDSTFEIASKWLKINKSLFSKVQIIKNNINIGINKNFLQAISKISTKKFKLLAGDDLFFKNNIFSINAASDITFSPIIKYNGKNVIGYSSIQRLLIFKSNNNYRKQLKIENIFNAPGSFLLLKFFDDKNLIESLSKFSFLEDYPLWFYLFNKYKNIKVNIDLYPYVIYRIGEGISTQTNISYNKFEIDQKKFKILNQIPYKKFQKYLNPTKYLNKLTQIFFLKPFNLLFKDVVVSNRIILEEVSKAQNYIDLIKEKSIFFEKNYL